MVEAVVGGREAVGPVLGVVGEVGVPGQRGPSDGAGDGGGGLPGLVVDLEGGGLGGGEG